MNETKKRQAEEYASHVIDGFHKIGEVEFKSEMEAVRKKFESASIMQMFEEMDYYNHVLRRLQIAQLHLFVSDN